MKLLITIKTTNVPIEKLPSILERIKVSFSKGYVRGAGWNAYNNKEYTFDTVGVTEEDV
jgi:hypothetical protein